MSDAEYSVPAVCDSRISAFGFDFMAYLHYTVAAYSPIDKQTCSDGP
jgi:hypothetical protein